MKVPSVSSLGSVVVPFDCPIPVQTTKLIEVVHKLKTIYKNIDILEIIHVGGNSIVIKAFDNDIRKYIAIKFPAYAIREFAPTLCGLDEAIPLIERIKDISQKCPNVARIIDYSFEPFPHVFEEFVEGKSLRQILNEGRRLDIKEVLSFIESIVEAIMCLHKYGVYHNDIRPENIIISPNGIKLLDIGVDNVWRLLTTAFGGEQSTLREKIAPCYNHPKIKLTDESLDIFQIGVLMYELILGFNPFCNRETTEIKPLSTIVAEIPSRLDLLIQRMTPLATPPMISLPDVLTEIRTIKQELGVK